MFKRTLAAALLVLTGACQTTGGDLIGQGDITLSPGITAALDRYMETFHPMAFAVTEDGQGGWYLWCNDPMGCMSQHRVKQRVTQICEERTGRTCKVLAEGQKIIWRGTVTRHQAFRDDAETQEIVCYASGRVVDVEQADCKRAGGVLMSRAAAESGVGAAALALPKDTQEIVCYGAGRVLAVRQAECKRAGGVLMSRDAAEGGTIGFAQGGAGEARPGVERLSDIEWEGVFALNDYPAKLLQTGPGGYSFALFPEPVGSCNSLYELTGARAGTWELVCENNHSASGTFETLTGGAGSIGIGLDNQGRAVTFRVKAL